MNTAESARLELLDEFRQGTMERLERINLAWIAIEVDAKDARAVDELLGELHTLKGEAKMMGFYDVSLIAHRAEDLVIAAREAVFKDLPGVGDLLLWASDAVSTLIQKRAGAPHEEIDLAALLQRIDLVVARAEAQSADRVMTPLCTGQFPSQPAASDDLLSVDLKPADKKAWIDSKRRRERSFRVDFDRILEFSESASALVMDYARLERSVRDLEEVQRQQSAVFGALDRATAAIRFQSLDDHTSVTQEQREHLEAIKKTQERFVRVALTLKQQVEEGAQNASYLEDRASKLRVVPIKEALNKHVRLARDIARGQGKRVVVDIQDGGVVLDRHVAHQLAEPILHLVHNCVDHGLESTDQRRNAGKPEFGRIVLSASSQDDTVTVSVADDGRGIDPNKIRERARSLSLLSEEEILALDDEAAIRFLFQPRFTTKNVATETSGRGVGLDVVQRQIEALGGRVRIHTTLGVGTWFSLTLPVSVALTRVLLVRSHGHQYALPGARVVGVVDVGTYGVREREGRLYVRFRGRSVAVVDPSSLLGLAPSETSERVLILSPGSVEIAMFVSEWAEDKDVVVQPQGDLLDRDRLVLGVCRVEGGGSASVLNPDELVSRGWAEYPAGGASSISEVAGNQTRVLLVDDSPITRSVISRYLSARNLVVREAADGHEAMAMLHQEPFQLVFTDIEMPKMDGYAFLEAARRVFESHQLPIVVLSTRGSKGDRRKAVVKGADAYLVKTEFCDAVLTEVLGRFLGEPNAYAL